jgi:hypothetical protein
MDHLLHVVVSSTCEQVTNMLGSAIDELRGDAPLVELLTEIKVGLNGCHMILTCKTLTLPTGDTAGSSSQEKLARCVPPPHTSTRPMRERFLQVLAISPLLSCIQTPRHDVRRCACCALGACPSARSCVRLCPAASAAR